MGYTAEQVSGYALHLSFSIVVLDGAKPVMDQYLKYRMFLYVFPLLAVEVHLASGPGKILIIQVHLKGGIILTDIGDCPVQFIDYFGITLGGGKIKGSRRKFSNRTESLGQGYINGQQCVRLTGINPLLLLPIPLAPNDLILDAIELRVLVKLFVMVICLFQKRYAQSLEIRKIIFINAVIIIPDRNHTVRVAVVFTGKIKNRGSLLVVIHGSNKIQFPPFQHIHHLNQLFIHGSLGFHKLIGPSCVLSNLFQIIIGITRIITIFILHGQTRLHGKSHPNHRLCFCSIGNKTVWQYQAVYCRQNHPIFFNQLVHGFSPGLLYLLFMYIISHPLYNSLPHITM